MAKKQKDKLRHEPTDHARNYCQIAYDYAVAAANDKAQAKHCKWVRLAAKRHIDDLKRKKFDYHFSEWHGNDICDFIEKLPHVEGSWDSETIQLEPPQIFMLVVIFGWRRGDYRRFTNVYIEMARKGAKAEWVDNLIPTPSGFKRMGDIKPGDLVFGSNGKPVSVRAATEPMFNKECMSVSFATGEKIVVASDHMWKVNQRIFADNHRKPWTTEEDETIRKVYPNGGANALQDAMPYRSRFALQKRAGTLGVSTGSRHFRAARRLLNHRNFSLPKPKDILSTQKIKKTLTYGNRKDNRYSVNVSEPIQCDVANLPIPPYVLGAWLGDGSSKSARITIGYSDLQIAELIRATGITCDERKSSNKNSGSYILGKGGKKNSLQTKLRASGLLGNKHIPTNYLRSSVNQRLELLRGLMDTDGTICKRGHCSFANCNKKLASDVHHLVCSLGMKATIVEKPAVLNGKYIRPSYLVSFYPTTEKIVFGLNRKKERQICRPNGTRAETRSITAVESVSSVPVKCIEVDAEDGLYLTGKSFIPTHNSTLTAGVSIYCLTCENEPGPQVIVGATTGQQAQKVFNPAQKMVKKTPALREAFNVTAWARSITCDDNGGFIQTINSKSDTQDGWNPHVGILDELHAHKDRGLYDVIRSAFGSRKNPLMWCITTAGYILDGVCFEQRTLVTKILQGLVEADHYFGIIFTLDGEKDFERPRKKPDDPLDPKVWPKANPMLGVTPTIESMETLAIEAAASPDSMAEFMTKRCNLWLSAKGGWLNMEHWKRCGGAVDLVALETVPAYAGLDLASVSDIAAWVIVWLLEDIVYCFCRFYLPEDTIEPRTKKANLPYMAWVDQGFLTKTPGNVTDYNFIKKDVKADLDRFNIQEAGYDPWNATQIVNDLVEDGAPMVEMRQGAKTFHPPMQELERIIKATKLRHGNNPVLSWMASNIVARRDVNNNMAPDKKNSQEKIDGIVALLMGLGRLIVKEDTTSIYESRGVLTFGG